MTDQLKIRATNIFKSIGAFLSRGMTPYIFVTLYLAVATLWVYFDPRSLLAFLMFLTAFGLTYYVKTNNKFKVTLLVIIALVLVPIIG